MPRFESFDGLEIAYEEMGQGPVALLHHGFASDSVTNWVRPGVAAAVAAAGRRVVLIDARGHGRSEKPHDPASYGDHALACDVQALLDHLGVEQVDVVGYSMGAFIAMLLPAIEPRVRSLVLGGAGLGQESISGEDRVLRIAEALEADDPNGISDATARAFRNFADATGADRLALAALQRARTGPPGLAQLQAIAVPTLVVNGERDTMVGPPESLAKAIPGARFAVVPGDHISAVVKPEFRQSILDFLADQPPVG
jgi:pimeloyl-ACP methyl ester carboxylesterase